MSRAWSPTWAEAMSTARGRSSRLPCKGTCQTSSLRTSSQKGNRCAAPLHCGCAQLSSKTFPCSAPSLSQWLMAEFLGPLACRAPWARFAVVLSCRPVDAPSPAHVRLRFHLSGGQVPTHGASVCVCVCLFVCVCVCAR